MRLHVCRFICLRACACTCAEGRCLTLDDIVDHFHPKRCPPVFFFFLAFPDKIFGFRRRVERCRTHAFLFYRLKLLHSNISKKKKNTSSRSEEKKKSRATKLSDTADFDTGSGRNTSYIFSSNSVILRLAYYIYFGLLCESLSLCVEDFSCNDSALKALQ